MKTYNEYINEYKLYKNKRIFSEDDPYGEEEWDMEDTDEFEEIEDNFIIYGTRLCYVLNRSYRGWNKENHLFIWSVDKEDGNLLRCITKYEHHRYDKPDEEYIKNHLNKNMLFNILRKDTNRLR
jgi:hypothetical protein